MKIPTVPDLVKFGSEQVEAIAALPSTLALLNRSLTSFAQTVSRLDTLVKRIDRLTEPLEGPLSQLVPRLEALVPLLDEELMKTLPIVLESVKRNAVPALEVIGQTQAQVASIASSVERLMTMMDDTFARLQDLPGMGLVTRLRGGSAGAGPAGPAGASGAGTGASGGSGSSSAGAPPKAPAKRASRSTRGTEERRSW